MVLFEVLDVVVALGALGGRVLFLGESFVMSFLPAEHNVCTSCGLYEPSTKFVFSLSTC